MNLELMFEQLAIYTVKSTIHIIRVHSCSCIAMYIVLCYNYSSFCKAIKAILFAKNLQQLVMAFDGFEESWKFEVSF
jgi:hypothetical protein